MSVIHADVVRWLRANQWQAQNGYLPKAHAVFADPPYGLAFMNSRWDTHATPQDFQHWVTEWASLLIDFCYPGAVLAMFGGTRTYHRLAAGLEDAGWEVFDCMMYVYGSGFPKSHNISKALDRQAGAEREVVGTNPNHRPLSGVEYEGIYNGGNTGAPHITAPATDAAKQWDGYGSALKPSFEPVVLARAPRGAATYAELAQRHGTAALNVDGARIPANGDVIRSSHNVTIGGNGVYQGGKAYDTGALDGRRYPANLILDDAAAAVMDAQSGESVSSGGGRHDFSNGLFMGTRTDNFTEVSG